MKKNRYRFGLEHFKRQLDIVNKYNFKYYGFKIVIVKRGASNGPDERAMV